MRNTNMRKGFTMIELIFVIVIIGILAAVAIPKMANTSKQAVGATYDSLVATLNNTVGPTMWMDQGRPAAGVACDTNQTNYITMPDGLILTAACDVTGEDTTEVGDITLVNIGSSIESPRWVFTAN